MNEERNIKKTISIQFIIFPRELTLNLQIFETKFTLNDTLGVKDLDPMILLTVNEKQRDVLLYYFYEYTIFLKGTYQESKETSKEFYDFFTAHIESLSSVDAKSKFLKHTRRAMCLQ